MNWGNKNGGRLILGEQLIQPELEDKPGEECGIVGVYMPDGVATPGFVVGTTHEGMYALGHRGQLTGGMAVSMIGEDYVHIEKNVGDVTKSLGPAELKTLHGLSNGRVAIGHNRYGTSGNSSDESHIRAGAQPFGGTENPFALASNGHIEHDDLVRAAKEFDLEPRPEIVSDTEGITELLDQLTTSTGDMSQSVKQLMKVLDGALNFVIAEPSRLIVSRDPTGYRPLSIGQLPNGGYMAASETVAFNQAGATFLRDVEAGEIITIDEKGLSSDRVDRTEKERLCYFEFAYFAHPNSRVRGRNIQDVREALGERLGEEHPVEADIVVPVPESGMDYATGYARATGIPISHVLKKNRYVARTFIEDGQAHRVHAVRRKLMVNSEMVQGKRLVVIDDSVVRGTTAKETMDMLLEAGAEEAHLRIPSATYNWPCYFGMATSEIERLIAHGQTEEEIREAIHATSLKFLGMETIRGVILDAGKQAEANGETPLSLCDSCNTGEYAKPVPITIGKNDTTAR